MTRRCVVVYSPKVKFTTGSTSIFRYGNHQHLMSSLVC